tara:strand:+ start:2126 stop:2920 length:795 start_codon:yes stop_codon:yes gene_type:complete
MNNKDITIVTCYLDIDKSKHGKENYKIWIMNYLSIIKNNNIVIYCNCDRTIRLILELRSNYLNKTKIVKINIQDLYTYKYIDYFTKDNKKDPEKYHVTELYLIWNNKVAFMYDAFKNKYFDTEYYMWTDIGMLREEKLYDILNANDFKCNVEKLNKNKIILLKLNNFTKEELSYKNTIIPYKYKTGINRCGGGAIISSKFLMEKWFNIYYSMLDTFISNDFFAGKDQNILNNIYIKYGDDLFNLIEPNDYNLDKWFYILYYITN